MVAQYCYAVVGGYHPVTHDAVASPPGQGASAVTTKAPDGGAPICQSHPHLSSGHCDHNTTTTGDISSCAPRRSQEATHQHVWPHRQQSPQQSAATIAVDISTIVTLSAEWSHTQCHSPHGLHQCYIRLPQWHQGHTLCSRAFHTGSQLNN